MHAAVGVSAVTGEGCEELFDAIDLAALEFERDYQPQLDAQIKARQDERQAALEKQQVRTYGCVYN